MKWYRGIRRRILKKRIHYISNGGRLIFSFRQWERELNEVMTLKKGDKVFNPYIQDWTTIEEIEFDWSPIHKRGSYISEYTIYDTLGYLICDPPSRYLRCSSMSSD